MAIQSLPLSLVRGEGPRPTVGIAGSYAVFFQPELMLLPLGAQGAVPLSLGQTISQAVRCGVHPHEIVWWDTLGSRHAVAVRWEQVEAFRYRRLSEVPRTGLRRVKRFAMESAFKIEVWEDPLSGSLAEGWQGVHAHPPGRYLVRVVDGSGETRFGRRMDAVHHEPTIEAGRLVLTGEDRRLGHGPMLLAFPIEVPS